MSSNTFSWCGYNWRCDMNGRIIHPDQPWMWYGPDEIKLTDNNIIELGLKYNPKKITYNDKDYKPKYETSVIRSVEDFSYGEFSCEIKLPQGVGLWPSFWLTGSGNWPPEIDIMEAWSRNSNYYVFPLSRRITNNIHYNDDNLNHCNVGSKNQCIFDVPKNPIHNFIEYKCIWSRDSIEFFVNGKSVHKITGYECHELTDNLKNPKKGFKMNVVFDLWIDNPIDYKIKLDSPLLIKNFTYQPN